MLGLPELKALNDAFALKQAEASKTRQYNFTTPIGPFGKFIIVVRQPGKETVYYDRGEHYVHDRTKVNGWPLWDNDIAQWRVEELQQMVHSEAVVSLESR